MRKVILLFAVMAILIPFRSAFSQTLNDYVKQIKGDTLVIKDYSDMNNQPNSLYYALILDSAVIPQGRVYELQAGGWYPLQNNPVTSSKQSTMIAGSNPAMMVNNKDTLLPPPLISGYVGSLSTNIGSINAKSDLTIKNCVIVLGASDGKEGWCFTSANAANLHLTFDNCIFEHTLWVFVQTRFPNCNVTLRNSYFVNMSGHSCRRTGGVFDYFTDMDTLLVENCTHIMSTGSLYRFRATPDTWQIKRIIINHNTFINNSGYVFMNPGCQDNISLTNNIFVNSNVQPYPGIPTIDTGEQDPDLLPMGLVNVYPDSAIEANHIARKFLIEGNCLYWDPYLANCADTCNQIMRNNKTGWTNQMILMNTRTRAMFDNNTDYPYLTEGVQYSVNPNFTDPKDLFGAQLVALKRFSVSTVDTTNIEVLPDWRLINTASDKYINPDWPIPVDLSYSDATLLTGATNGFPVGDLNWFPVQKTAWLSQREAEYASIQSGLDQGRPSGVKEVGAAGPNEFNLDQNYPNPFNPTTVISYKLAVKSEVRLRIYDILGREIVVLVNEVKNAGNYKVEWNGINSTGLQVGSGVYFYQLSIKNGFVDAKKMILLK